MDFINFNQYSGIEPGLHYANRKFISINGDEMEMKREYVEVIVKILVNLMKKVSPTFRFLFAEIFGGGSVYDKLKITKADEFDIDILLRFPAFLGPQLLESNIPGYVNLKLLHLDRLRHKRPQVYEELLNFVDEKNYLLTKELKQRFMQSVFDKVLKKIGDKKLNFFKIKKVQSLGPAFTISLQGPSKFVVKVDLVPCILLDQFQWPQGGFASNPYREPNDFFIVPKSPKRDTPHIERYWRLSFQKQEREIMFDNQWLKPTIRILKRIRDNFQHQISSYALKNLVLNIYRSENPYFLGRISALWATSFSYTVVYVLKEYLNCLLEGEIPYFWNQKMNLLEDLNSRHLDQYVGEIEYMLDDIENDPTPHTIIKYLR